MGKLTARGVDSLVRRKGRYSDGDGLFLRVLDPGRRAYWVYRYRANGRERETSLGSYPTVTLADARAKHIDMRKLVKDKVDPVGDRRKVMVAPPSGKPTFGQCADAYIRAHESGWRGASTQDNGRRQGLSCHYVSRSSLPCNALHATTDKHRSDIEPRVSFNAEGRRASRRHGLSLPKRAADVVA
jgi:hypothetical protein